MCVYVCVCVCVCVEYSLMFYLKMLYYFKITECF